MRTVQATGKSRAEAVKQALSELNLTEDQVVVKVLQEGSRGLFGLFGGREYVVQVEEKNTAKTPEEFFERELSAKSMKSENRLADLEIPEETAPGEQRSQKRDYTAHMQRAEEFLQEVLDSLSMQAVIHTNQKNGALYLQIEGEKAGKLIGRRGEALDALQMLLGLCVNQKGDGYVRVHLDIENYRQKREESLVRFAHKMARSAAKSKRSVHLEPMSANERRIVHAALQSDAYVTTYSEGEEPYRRVVIAYKR